MSTKPIDWGKPVRWRFNKEPAEVLCQYVVNGIPMVLLKWGLPEGKEGSDRLPADTDMFENVPPEPVSVKIKVALATHPKYGERAFVDDLESSQLLLRSKIADEWTVHKIKEITVTAEGE